jgi:hypothetical protein
LSKKEPKMSLTPEQKASAERLVILTNNDPILRAVPVGGNNGPKASDEEVSRLSAAERLDRCRQFQQSLPDGRRQDDAKMPPWKDPRV